MRLFWKPPRIFFGWWIVVAALLTQLYIFGVVVGGFTTIFEPIAEDLHWSYAQISLAASIRGVGVAFLSPIMGLLFDRWGARRLLFSGITSIALGLFLLSQVTSLGMYYGAFVLISIGLSASTFTVVMATLANWFRRKISLVIGIVSCGPGLAGLMVPLMVRLIDLYEWRMTIIILAVGLLVLILPLSLLFRHRPEHYGYLPDGKAENEVKQDKILTPQPTDEPSIGVGQALKSRVFWHLAISFLLYQLMILSVSTHIMPYLSSVGLARSISAFITTAVQLTSIAGCLGFGWLGDRFNRKRITTAGFVMIGVGILIFGYVSTANIWLLVPFCILYGIGYGCSDAMRPSIVTEYFGRTNIGTILGFILSVSVIGSIVGPPVAGWVFDTWGSYQSIWLIYAATGMLATVIMASTPPVSPRIRLSSK